MMSTPTEPRMSLGSDEFVWDESVSSFSTPPPCGEGWLNVMWWNIQFGNTNQWIAAKRNGLMPLDRNLQALMDVPWCPDVLALGEFNEKAISNETMQKLHAAYPYSLDSYIPYNSETPDMGFMLLSKYRLKAIRQECMDYYPPTWSNQRRISKYQDKWAKDFPDVRLFQRPYCLFEICQGEESVFFVPTHILSHAIKVLKNSKQKSWSMMRVKMDLAFAKRSPLIHQLGRLRAFLEEDFGPFLDKKNLVVMGDFNFPRKIFITTPAYRLISKGMVDPFLGREVPTWPAKESREAELLNRKNGYQIDLSFVSKNVDVRCSEVVPMQGSDHLPVYLSVRTSASLLVTGSQ